MDRLTPSASSPESLLCVRPCLIHGRANLDFLMCVCEVWRSIEASNATQRVESDVMQDYCVSIGDVCDRQGTSTWPQ
jgi:hypothetical protein